MKKPEASPKAVRGGQLLFSIVVGIVLGVGVFFGVRAVQQWQSGTPQVRTQADWIQGTAGKDVIRGPERDMMINGEAGDDRISGGTGDDIINGGPGDDQIDGGAGVDLINGEDGSDTLTLGADGYSDLVDAGPGDDTIILHAGSAAPKETEDLSCGEGTDRVILKGFPQGVALHWPLSDPNGGAYVNTANDCEMLTTGM